MKSLFTHQLQAIVRLVTYNQWLYIALVISINIYVYFILNIFNTYSNIYQMLFLTGIVTLLPGVVYHLVRKYTDGVGLYGSYGGLDSFLFGFSILPFFGIFFSLYLTYDESKILKKILEQYNGKFTTPAERFELNKNKSL
jgi:hypothetical protein